MRNRVKCCRTGIAALEGHQYSLQGHESACFGACFGEMMSLKVRGTLIMLGLDRLTSFFCFLYVPVYGSCLYGSQPRISPAQTHRKSGAEYKGPSSNSSPSTYRGRASEAENVRVLQKPLRT